MSIAIKAEKPRSNAPQREENWQVLNQVSQ